MNKKLLKLSISGFIITSIIGTVLHFVYEWSGESKISSIFAPVNESPWEHLKMLYFPFLLFIILSEYIMRQDKFNIFYSGYTAIVIGMTATLCYFYALNGIIGGNNEWVNLSSYFVGMAIAFIINYFLVANSVGRGLPNGIAVAMLIITILAFILFTYKPPIIPLFQDPKDYSFGIR